MAVARLWDMARIAGLTIMILALVAIPASAATRISYRSYPGPFEPWGPEQFHILLVGDSGANHDIQISANNAQQIYGYPQLVDVYDYGDTFAEGAASPDYPHPCRIYSAHHAACLTSGPPAQPGDPYSYPSLASIEVDTGDGNDSVNFSDKLNPLVVSVNTGAGDDNVSLDGAWPCYEHLGGGNDTGTFGTIPPVAPPYDACTGGWWVYGEDGNDSLNTLNGSQDHVNCGPGSDTEASDPLDTTGSCESGTL
jgi:hypothetical protein